MKTYPAYKLLDDANSEICIFWWNGERIKSTSTPMLTNIKDRVIDGLSYSDGESFFDKLPALFRSGYLRVKKVEVDKDGKVL